MVNHIETNRSRPIWRMSTQMHMLRGEIEKAFCVGNAIDIYETATQKERKEIT